MELKSELTCIVTGTQRMTTFFRYIEIRSCFMTNKVKIKKYPNLDQESAKVMCTMLYIAESSVNLSNFLKLKIDYFTLR